MESETAKSELKLGNTTGRLVQLEREVGFLRQNSHDVIQLEQTAKQASNQAKLDADEAQQVPEFPTSIRGLNYHLQPSLK